MHIQQVVTTPGRGGFFNDDQIAVLANAKHDGFDYIGRPRSRGFSRVREPGEALSVLLMLSDGGVAVGDCAAVQYAGVAGRDQLFHAAEGSQLIERFVTPLITGREVTTFRELAAEIEELDAGGSPLPAAVRYGVSQAILDAVARTTKRTMAEVVRDEFGTGVPLVRVPIFAQTGDDRYIGVDKMILKEVDELPHGLINNVEEKVGSRGEKLEAYLQWVRDRIVALRRTPDYRPVIHVDVYGTIGFVFGLRTEAVAAYLARLGDAMAPFQLRVEHPIDAGSRDAQVEACASLRAALTRLGSNVQIVVDEWCNTLEDISAFVDARAADMVHVKTPDLGGIQRTASALIMVKSAGLLAYCGGSANETDRSAQVCAHVAMACEADLILAKPGMGIDEGLMIVANEMSRIIALTEARAEVALETDSS
jgi:methylaspartate ammonia-lyase